MTNGIPESAMERDLRLMRAMGALPYPDAVNGSGFNGLMDPAKYGAIHDDLSRMVAQPPQATNQGFTVPPERMVPVPPPINNSPVVLPKTNPYNAGVQSFAPGFDPETTAEKIQRSYVNMGPWGRALMSGRPDELKRMDQQTEQDIYDFSQGDPKWDFVARAARAAARTPAFMAEMEMTGGAAPAAFALGSLAESAGQAGGYRALLDAPWRTKAEAAKDAMVAAGAPMIMGGGKAFADTGNVLLNAAKQIGRQAWQFGRLDAANTAANIALRPYDESPVIPKQGFVKGALVPGLEEGARNFVQNTLPFVATHGVLDRGPGVLNTVADNYVAGANIPRPFPITRDMAIAIRSNPPSTEGMSQDQIDLLQSGNRNLASALRKSNNVLVEKRRPLFSTKGTEARLTPTIPESGIDIAASLAAGQPSVPAKGIQSEPYNQDHVNSVLGPPLIEDKNAQMTTSMETGYPSRLKELNPIADITPASIPPIDADKAAQLALGTPAENFPASSDVQVAVDNSVKRTPNRRANRGVIQVYGKPIGPPITKTNPLDDLIKLAQEAKDNGGVVKTPPDQNIVNVVRKSFLDPKDYDRVTLALGRGDRGLGAQILAQQPRLVSLALGKPGQAKIAMDILDKWNAVGGTAPMEVPAQAPVVTPADVPPSVAPPDAIQPEIPASVPPADVPVAGAVPEPAPALPVGLNPAEALPAERKPNLGRVGPLAPEPVQAPMIEQGKLDNKHGAVWPLKPEVGIVEPPKAPSSKPSYSVQLPQPAVNEGARTSKVSTNDSTHWANVKHGWVDLADPAYVKYLTSSEAQRDTGVNSQNREMTRIARTQAHAKRLANFDPQRITTSRTSQEGAAVINTDGVPLTGRDRLLLISEVYALPDSDPRKQNLLSEYASTGADLAGPIPNGMKKPALVRVATDFNGVTPEEFARESDQPTTDVMSDVEKSRADTDAIAGVIKTLYDDDGNITKKGIDTFVKLVGSPGDLIDQDGKPTKAAEKRIERAALMYLMGGKNADVHMVSFVDEHIGNVGLSRQVQGIAQMSGKLSQLSELHPEFSINDDLTKALQVSIQSKSDYLNGLSDNPMGYINQPELGKAIDPNVDRLARMLLLSKSPKEVRDVLQEYIDRVESGGDQTTDMFTGEIPPTTKSQLIEKITHPYSESRMDATPVVEDPELARLHKLVDYHGTTLDPNQAQGIWIDKNGKPVFVNNNIMEDRNRPGKSADWKGERGANDMLSLMKNGFVRLVSGKDFVLIHALSNPGPECDDLLRRAIDGKPTVHVNLGVGNRFTMRNPTFEELRARMGIELGGTRLSYEGGTGKGTGNADYADEFGDRIDAEYEKVKAEEANQYAQTPDLKDAVANIKAKLVPVTDLLQARFVSPSGELLGVHSDEYLKGNGNLSTQSHTDLAGGQKQFDALMRGGWARVKAEGESLYLQTHSLLNVNHFDTIQRIGKGKQQIGVDLSGIYHEFGNLYSRGKVPVDTLVAQLKNANRQVAQPSVMPPSIPLGNKDIVNSHMDTTAGGTGSTTKFDQAIQAAKEHYARTQGTTKEANVGHLHNKPETQPGANGEAVRGMAATETGAKASQPDIEEFVKSSNAYANEFGFGNIKAYSKNGKAYMSIPNGQDAEVVFSSDLGSKADPISMAQALADCGHINNENEYYSMSDGEKNALHKKLKVHGLFNKSEPNKIWINWESFKEENRPTGIHEALHKAVFHELDRMGGKYFRSSFTPEVEEQWIRHVLDNNIPFPSGVSPPVKKIMDNVVNRMKPDVSSPLNRGKA